MYTYKRVQFLVMLPCKKLGEDCGAVTNRISLSSTIRCRRGLDGFGLETAGWCRDSASVQRVLCDRPKYMELTRIV